MDTSNPIWNYLLGQAPVVVVLALLVYYMFRFFNKLKDDETKRWEERELSWKRDMAEKDKLLSEQNEKIIELTKIAVETQTAVISKLNEFLREIKNKL